MILRLPESTLKRATRSETPSGPPVNSLAAGEVNLQQARIITNRYQRSDRGVINLFVKNSRLLCNKQKGGQTFAASDHLY